VDAAQALADLTEISSQVVDVVIVDESGAIMATTADDPGRARRFVAGIQRLITQADELRGSRGLPNLAQLEVATLEGSVFVVRQGERLIAATTRPDPTVGLVFYDLKHCLRSVEDGMPTPGPAKQRRPSTRKKSDAPA
jgi:predicted regulator of Ras-like GTPase activity (Roadblock/LC7/MglB family)